MKVLKNVEEFRQLNGEESIHVTIGNFDGVHLGHREFLSKIAKDALEAKAKFVVVTFVPHPVQLLRGHSSLLINTFAERRELLLQCGVDYVLEIDFTRDFSTLTPERFLQEYIFSLGKVETLYLGHDFVFGANKTGDFHLAENICQKKNVKLVLQDEFKLDNASISSSAVRAAVSEGDIEKANQLLGRNYFLSGRVIKGQGRGKQIGFPTANVDFDKELIIPSRGVYITKTTFKDMTYNSITNIGINPTFNSGDVIHIETHLFDFDSDIYGEEVRVSFLRKLRDEKKFSCVNDLVAQIKADAEVAKGFFKL